jgi:hypothetical protein
MAWTRGARIGRADGVVQGYVEQLLVVMQPATGEYAGLDGVALRLWELLAPATTFGDLVDTLVAEYQVPRSECAPDIARCLEGLRRQGIVTLASARPAAKMWTSR